MSRDVEAATVDGAARSETARRRKGKSSLRPLPAAGVQDGAPVSADGRLCLRTVKRCPEM